MGPVWKPAGRGAEGRLGGPDRSAGLYMDSPPCKVSHCVHMAYLTGRGDVAGGAGQLRSGSLARPQADLGPGERASVFLP